MFVVMPLKVKNGHKRKAAGKVNKVPLTDLFTKKQLPITLIIFLVCYSIFSVNWPVVGLLPLYLKENGYAENVKSLMFWAGFGILIGTLIAGFIGDKLGEKKTFVYSLLLSLFFLFPVFYLPENNVLALGALLFFLLATNLGIAGLVPKYMATFFRPKCEAQVLVSSITSLRSVVGCLL